MAELWRTIDTGLGDAAWNMAFDEALLAAAPRLGAPVLRFYGWRRPAASFGYFQRYDDVARWTALRPLVRRPTGGGWVPHVADWTYSVVFPSGHAWHRLRAVESYRRLHDWLREAFEAIGLHPHLTSDGLAGPSGQCFARAERFDLVSDGRKIAGAAQRRTRSGLLIQGSVQPPPKADRGAWQQAVLDTAAARFGIQWQRFDPDPALLEAAARLTADKYARPGYTRKRLPGEEAPTTEDASLRAPA